MTCRGCCLRYARFCRCVGRAAEKLDIEEYHDFDRGGEVGALLLAHHLCRQCAHLRVNHVVDVGKHVLLKIYTSHVVSYRVLHPVLIRLLLDSFSLVCWSLFLQHTGSLKIKQCIEDLLVALSLEVEAPEDFRESELLFEFMVLSGVGPKTRARQVCELTHTVVLGAPDVGFVPVVHREGIREARSLLHVVVVVQVVAEIVFIQRVVQEIGVTELEDLFLRLFEQLLTAFVLHLSTFLLGHAAKNQLVHLEDTLRHIFLLQAGHRQLGCGGFGMV